jgi:hypothetical protein
MPDGQCLLFHYPTVFPASVAAYVRPVVKIELGARSDDWPHEEKSIQPYVIEHFPALDPSPFFSVRVLAAERTFWEKACLLHEETFRPPGKPRKFRMARHYYDLASSPIRYSKHQSDPLHHSSFIHQPFPVACPSHSKHLESPGLMLYA